jgi:hypothetical protein
VTRKRRAVRAANFVWHDFIHNEITRTSVDAIGTAAFLRAMRGLGFYIVGTGILLVLVGCGRGFMSGERAPWRHDAEVACMKSGSVKIGTGIVRVDPIEGPGMCGADFPLKVAALGESSSVVGYADDVRPPGSIPERLGADALADRGQYAPPAAILPCRACSRKRHECAGYLDRRRPSNLAILRRADNRFRSARPVSHPLKRVLLRRARLLCLMIFPTMLRYRLAARRRLTRRALTVLRSINHNRVLTILRSINSVI